MTKEKEDNGLAHKLILIANRYNANENKNQKGILSFEQYNLERNVLMDSILNLMKIIEDKYPNYPSAD